jgi:SAM-dependent methyltransferase
LTRLFLEDGNRVFGAEPNAEMRKAGEQPLGAVASFTSVTGTAEATTLPDASVHIVATGQAFHWFDPQRAKGEFQRILRPPGWVTLLWNERLSDFNARLAGYERLLQEFATDYSAADHRRVTNEVIESFFAPNPVTFRAYKNREVLGSEGLRPPVSSSYVPSAGAPRHAPMLAALETLFREHQQNEVAFEYVTKVYTAVLGKGKS